MNASSTITAPSKTLLSGWERALLILPGLAALVLGYALGFTTAAMRWSAAPAALLFAAFAITRLLPFEQEFESLLFGWYKLIPFVLCILAVYPLRRASWHSSTVAARA